MELSIKNMAGQETGKKVVLNDAVFGIEPNDHAIYLDVKQYLANNRQGTAKAKQRSENAHSTRKLGRQKGGGGARPGDLKSPVRVGGGTIFGPVPRDYSFKLNKKVKQLARRSALSMRAKQDQIIVLDALHFDAPKTKAMIEVLDNLKVSGRKVLIVLPEGNQEVLKSARNIQRTNVITAGELNTYAIMNANALVIVEGAVKAIEDIDYQTNRYREDDRRRREAEPLWFHGGTYCQQGGNQEGSRRNVQCTGCGRQYPCCRSQTETTLDKERAAAWQDQLIQKGHRYIERR